MNSFTGKSDGGDTSEFQEDLNIFREIYFFAGLPLDMLKLLAYLSTRDTYKPGDVLFEQGDEDDRAYFIIAGQATLEDSTGGQTRPIRTYQQGDFIGGLALLGRVRRLFALKATTDLVCLSITREKFTKALEQFPENMPKIIKAIIERISAWDDRFLKESTSDHCEACRNNAGVSLL
ncbi:MAG: cyclic nucleotide-binding domain-containing protein [Desulfobacterales bacterium]|nr:cyclic nucleotide-binding domain-containing protein [Desulfobacterales bacterium]